MSAANTITPDKKRPNPVALEVLVSVTGARANARTSRELFTEETKTVLVFPDGAVIRLIAPVSLGQLLFLGNKRNNAEVVCKVMNIQPFTDAVSYVDLQFTEEKKKFWDVSFSTSTMSTSEFSIREHIEAEKAARGGGGAPVEAHSEEDVEQLKGEVEALRKQLLELEKKNEPAPEPSWPASLLSEAPSAPVVPRRVTTASQYEMDAPLMPAASSEPQGPARSVVGMALPIRVPPSEPANAVATEAASDPPRPPVAPPNEALLPKPALDFSQAPNRAPTAYVGLGLVRRRRRPFDLREWLVLILGGVLAVALVLGLWLGKPWRYFAGKKNVVAQGNTPESSAIPVSPAAAPDDAVSAPPATTSQSAPNSDSVVVRETPKDTAHAKRPDRVSAPPVADEPEPRDPGADTGWAAVDSKTAAKIGAKMHAKTAVVESKPRESAVDAATNDAPVLPPKLLRPVNPVYPPDALRNFIAGDVRAEAVVGADGRVGEVKVLAGPQQFRDAAVTALKQYQYAPATQAGKTIASKVTVTVKFWFDP